MRRRLDLAASLLASPPVCFLDEPTTGLDPRSRNELWALLRELVSGGTSILLTTQYLDEADQLCDRILVIDRGRTIAEGTPAELKGQVGGERVQLSVADPGELEEAALALAPFAGSSPEIDAERRLVTLPVSTSTSLLQLVRALDAAGVKAADVTRRTPTLDDVFLSLTGRASADVDQVDDTEHQLPEEVLG
jgi:ABC-2 type transport system ATP-binding protein